MYQLVIRALSAATAGTGTLVTTTGTTELRLPVSFAPWQPIPLTGLRAGERIASVPLPALAPQQHRLLLLTADGSGVEVMRTGPDGAEIAMSSATGTRSVVLAGSANRAEPARLVRNDVALPGHDADRDGLGTELEAAVGTCATRADVITGVPCRDHTDLRDTDGDGLADGLETVGGDSLPLPRWGANPRHKDMFIEVDFMRRTLDENADRVSTTMPATVARAVAAAYGDDRTTDPALRSLHAALLANPDGRPGIAVHLDTGAAPTTAADAAVFGDWGGFNAVDAIQVDGRYEGVAADDAWPVHLSATRRGVFRYALAYGGNGGGQTGRGFTASYTITSAFLAAHETGHSLGLNHGGPMSQALQVNCMPNYPSLMNYAYDSAGTGFADGRTAEAPSLNNAALVEAGGVRGASTIFLDNLENVFGYWVDRARGDVDWNRDGVIAPAGTVVRAYANFRPGGTGCEYTRWNRVAVPDAFSHLPPALARRGGTLYAFHGWDGDLRVATSTSSWNCPVPADGDCAGGTWSASVPADLPAPAAAVDAVTLGTGAGAQILVVAADLDRGLWERRLGGAGWLSGWRRLPGQARIGGPSLALASDGTAYLSYVDALDTYRLQTRSPAGVWSAEVPVVAADGRVLRRPTGSTASPAVVEATLAGVRGIYALFAAADDRLDLWRLDPATGRWRDTQLLDTRPGPVRYRPSMVWVPPGPASAVGRLYLTYEKTGEDGARMMQSYVRRTPAGTTPRVGLDAFFDNKWRTTFGMDLLFEPGVDTNVRALLAQPNNGQLWFRPKADGINDLTYTNQNDWTVMRGSLCADVVNPGGLVADPVRCAGSGPEPPPPDPSLRCEAGGGAWTCRLSGTTAIRWYLNGTAIPDSAGRQQVSGPCGTGDDFTVRVDPTGGGSLTRSFECLENIP